MPHSLPLNLKPYLFQKGHIPWIKGKHHSFETKCKIGAANKGKNGLLGKTLTPEHRQHISDTKKGIATRGSGWHTSEETKRKISLAKSGPKHPFYGKHYSPEQRLQKSIALRGSNGPAWRGGITPENHRIRGSVEYRLWREAVFKHDNFTCIICLATNGEGEHVVLNADHIYPFATFPSVRFKLENGRTLCDACHRKTSTFAGRTRPAPLPPN